MPRSFDHSPRLEETDPEKASLFVNIVIHDASEAIKAKVRESFNHSSSSEDSGSDFNSNSEEEDEDEVCRSDKNTKGKTTTKGNSNNKKRQGVDNLKVRVLDVAHKVLSTNTKNKIAHKHSQKVATDFDISEKITETVSTTICQQTLSILKQRGIKGIVRPVFIQGPYLVVEIHIQQVDSNKFDIYNNNNSNGNNNNIARSNPSSGAGDVDFVTGMLRTFGQVSPLIEQDFLPHMVRSHLFNNLEGVLQTKLQENLLVTDTIVVPEQYQARYFYSYSQELKVYQKVVLNELVSLSQRGGGVGRGSKNYKKQKPVPPPLPELHPSWRL